MSRTRYHRDRRREPYDDLRDAFNEEDRRGRDWRRGALLESGEVQRGVVEHEDVPDGNHATRSAGVLARWDAEETHHRGARKIVARWAERENRRIERMISIEVEVPLILCDVCRHAARTGSTPPIDLRFRFGRWCYTCPYV